VVNMADFTTAVAPGGLIQITGHNFTANGESAQDLPLPTSLAGICATVNNIPVPLFAVDSGLIQAQLPFNAAGQGSLVIRASGGTSAPFSFNVFSSAMAIFRTASAGPNTGLPTMYRAANWQVVTLTNAIRPNDTLIIFATGLGGTSPAVQNGYPAPSDPLAYAATVPTIELQGAQLGVQFAGLVPGLVGVYQINAVVPGWVKDGIGIPLKVTSGTYQTTLSVRVVTP
jgi:uncharacterized protein (TIGR03437 family)